MAEHKASSRCELLLPTDRRWAGVLEGTPHDFYHTAGYVELEARRLGGDARALLVTAGDQTVLLPLILRSFELDDGSGRSVLDATSPYGYCPPLLAAAQPRPADRGVAIARALRSGMADMGLCCAFVRLHPLLPRPFDADGDLGRLVTHGQTVYVDLDLPDEEIWRQTRSSDRTNIRRLERAGFAADIDASWEHFHDFRRIYAETMRRVGASDEYFFDDAYFEGLRSALGDSIRLVVVRHEGRIAAAGLFTECCGGVQFHLSGTADSYRAEGPSRLMLDFARRWAKSRGNRWLHLGGGLGAAKDSLFEFKAGFSHLRAEFVTWRIVTRAGPYAEAVAAWEGRYGVPGDPVDGHFPAYRKRPSHVR